MGGEVLETSFEHKKKSKYDENPGAISIDDPARAYDELHAVLTLLQGMGMQEAISVAQGTSVNKYGKEYARFKFIVNETGIAYDTIEEAVADIKKSSRSGKGIALRSREKNVSSATPVSVSKRGSGTGSSWSYGHNTVGAITVANSNKKKKGIYVSRRSVRHGDEEFDEPILEEDLEHYGRKGMKWYQHVFGDEKAYSKAKKKLEKLDLKVSKSENVVSKLQGKTLRRQERANNALIFRRNKARRAARSSQQLSQAYLRVQRRTEKAKKWYEAMEDVFKDRKVNDLKNTELGKKYADMTLDKMMSNTSSAATMALLSSYYQNKGHK